ncbi:MAG: hypothetical protein ABSH36_02570 [Solirubrobacteraceae bacterium]
MTVSLGSPPRRLQREVVQQRYFSQALRLALTGHDQRSMAELAQELRIIAANAFIAVSDARSRAVDGDWHEAARVAAIQSLAAATGASLLDRAGTALLLGEQQRVRFVAQTKHAVDGAHRHTVG